MENAIHQYLENSPIESKTIFFEGPDYAGKTTLIKELTRNYSFGSKNFLSSRGFPSNIIYGDFFGRNYDKEGQIDAFKRQLNSNENIYIFLMPFWEKIEERMQRGDDLIKDSQVREIYDRYANFIRDFVTHGNVIVYQDDKLFNHVSYNKSLIHYDWQTLLNTVLQKGSVNNYSMSYSFDYEKFLKELFVIQDEAQRIYLTVPKDYLNPKWFETYQKDIYDRDMMLSQIKFNSHIQIDYFSQLEKSRRFVAVNPTSCMSLLQFCLEEDSINVSATFRSSDVANLLLYDIQFIMESTIEFHNFLKTYKFKELEVPDLQKLKINLKINLNNAHVIFRSR